MSDTKKGVEAPQEEFETVKIAASIPTMMVVRYLMNLRAVMDQQHQTVAQNIESQIAALTKEIDSNDN